MLKKIASIFFIILLLLNSATMLFYYFSEIEIHKTEMREYIASVKGFHSNLLTEFEPHDIFELVNRDEISSNGKMYDIVKKETRDGHIVYYAISDDKEDELISDISRLTNHFPESGQRQERRINIQISKFLNRSQQSFCPQISYLSDKRPRCPYTHYLSPVRNILAPPLKTFSS